MTRRSLVCLAALACSFSASAQPPAPEAFFGHPMGADRKLVEWRKVVDYFEALGKASDRVRVEQLGTSTEGRPFIAAFLSSPETLRNLHRYREIQQQLADPRRLSMADAERLIRDGKTVVMITCSIHATEIASTQTALEFAYRMASGNAPKTRAILDNVIFILVPSLNPDGVDIVYDWYRDTLGTPYEGTAPPRLYHKYTGHDNNRDWYIFSQAETRLAIEKLHNVWHPQIVYDVHQQGPFASRMFVPPWLDPIDPNIDPIIAQMCNAVGSVMAADLTAAGRKGVAINAMYDFWTPARHYQAYHGGLRILSESASVRLATPMNVKPDQIQGSALGYNPRERSWNHLEPWMGGTWRVRNIMDDQNIAWESLLYHAATKREDMLRAFHAIGQRAVSRTSPHAFVIPAEQYDPGAAQKLLETLSFGQVEIGRASDDFTAGGAHFRAGAYIIRMAQPYASFAKTLLERQQYPDLRLYPGGPPKRPYDVTAHTLPLLMGVDVRTVEAPFDAPTEPAALFAFRANRTVRQGVLPGSDVNAWREANRLWSSSVELYRDEAGDWHTSAGAGRRGIPRPRVGLYKSWMSSMDEGWTRWLLEQFGFAYESLTNAEVQKGSLRARFDAIVFPDQRSNSILEGFRPGTMPPQYTGGIGEAGVEALRAFANGGGTLVFLNHSTELALERFGLKLKNAVQGVSNRDFYSPGSLLNVRLQRGPLTLGLPEEVAIWSEGSPAWEPGDSARAVAQYPDSGLLASGWLLGEKYLAGKSALVDVPYGKGHLVLFGMRPQYRAQSYQGFKMFFNSLLRSFYE